MRNRRSHSSTSCRLARCDCCSYRGWTGRGASLLDCKQHFHQSLDAQVISYPTNELLGYEALAERISVPSEPFAIVAESFSGPIGITLAARNLTHLRALVLVASFAQSPIAVPKFIGRFLPAPLVGMGANPRILRSTLLDSHASGDLVHEVSTVLRGVPAGVLAFRLRQILAVDVVAAFASNNVPTLYIRALRDRLVSSRVADRLSQVRPDLERAEIDGPHLIAQSNPQQVAGLIADFARRTM